MSMGVDVSGHLEIDLAQVRIILQEALALVDELDGVALDERTAVEGQPGESGGRSPYARAARRAKAERAERSQTMNRLSDRLQLAGALVRDQYWKVRGFTRPFELVVDGVSPDGDGTTPH